LSNSSDVTGWFILAITFYFFIMFIALAGIDLLKYYVDDFIKYKSKDMTGNTIGLTEKECIDDDIAHNSNEEDDVGTAATEFRDIQNKKDELTEKYSSTIVSASNSIKIISDIIFPLALWCFGSLKLFSFLQCSY